MHEAAVGRRVGGVHQCADLGREEKLHLRSRSAWRLYRVGRAAGQELPLDRVAKGNMEDLVEAEHRPRRQPRSQPVEAALPERLGVEGLDMTRAQLCQRDGSLHGRRNNFG